MILAVMIGNGAQLLLMTAVTLVFAVLGFLSPSSRGSLTTVMLIFYVCFGSVAGYSAARIYKMLGGEAWRQLVFLTAFLVSGVVFVTFLILNFFLWGANSSSAVPFGTMFALIVMWFLISAPLTFVGAFFGFRHPLIEMPCKTNQIPRQIPPQPLYLNRWVASLIGGILPFSAIFIELFFIMYSFWFHRIYYVFGFLALVFSILIITCSEVAILMCYFHLCSEDYYWQWRAFMTAGTSGFYVFLYSIVYFIRNLKVSDVSSAILYFVWSFILSAGFVVMTGTVGYLACLYFVRKIFGSIKVD
jgi:transmembrane 9 superfamily protein 2/4